jgi:hypothetical protein
MVEIFTTALLEARITAVPKTIPFRYSLVLTPEIKALIARKNALRRIAQRTKNSGDKRNYETHNSIVKDIYQDICTHSSIESENCAWQKNCYGVECWYDCAATHRQKIQIIHNKQLKIIMDRHWRHSTEALHEEAGVLSNLSKKS